MAKSRKPKISVNSIIFRPGARIGYAGAEDDRDFLENCYLDIGQVKQALDTEDPGSILLGRTGSGKTAAILHIAEIEDHVITIEPENLSLNFISNSNVLTFFHGIGVNLDLFFQLLWRHILCVELLHYHYNIRQHRNVKNPFEILKGMVHENKPKRKAIEYLEKWGASFWEETEERIREVVQTFETELTAGVDLAGLGVPINARGASKIKDEQKKELVRQASNVVNSVQIKSLSDLMDMMSEDIFIDDNSKYYILIDRLDENWVDDNLRYRLIRALIETIKAFRKIRTVKLIVVLRSDLLERVYRYTRSGGFQEEKYEDFNVPITWNVEGLFNLIDLRIGDLFKRKYTKENVHFYDVFPKRYRNESNTFDYLIQRTQMRPRDIISFANEVFIAVSGRSMITSNDIDKAEGEYSKKRLQALCTEWQEEHPYLELCIESLRNLPTRLLISELSEKTLERTLLSLCDKESSPDKIQQYACSFMENNCSFDEFRGHLVAILYKVGALGIKPNEKEQVHFAYESSFIFRPEDIEPEIRISITPMLWRALGNIKIKRRGDVVTD